MKHKIFHVLLVCEAILCLLLYFARESLPGVFTAVMSFPFEQLGLGLRMLSLSGSMGNLFSIILYSAVCLTPVAALFLMRRKRKLYSEDILPAVLSAVLFAVLYLMINPGLLGTYLGSAAGQSIAKAVLGGMVYSVLIGYVLLRILRLIFAADASRLQRYLAVLLYVLNILFVYLAFGAYFGDLLDSLKALRAGNTGNGQSLGMSYLFLFLQYLINALPYVLDILVVFAGLNLLKELTSDHYSEAALASAEKLSRLCGLALVINVVSNISFNLLQLVFIKTLSVVRGAVQIPLMSIAFVLAAFLLAQYIRENKQLKDDNDMFI